MKERKSGNEIVSLIAEKFALATDTVSCPAQSIHILLEIMKLQHHSMLHDAGRVLI